MKGKVLIGISGGVDSSVAAHLLKEEGWDVVGVFVFLQTLSDSPRSCCSIASLRIAYRVAKKLGIPFRAIDYTEPFRRGIIQMFIDEYRAGRTPNVCVFCNRDYKLGAIWKEALKEGAYMATGHYARTGVFRGRKVIRMGKDLSKDQSYFLSYLRPEMVERLLLPVGEYTKEEIREMARKLELETADREDSMDLCFVEGDYRDFLVKMGVKPREGEIVDIYGNVIGKHRGYAFYTVGQRRGLGVALGRRAYVVDIIPEENRIVVGFEEDVHRRIVIASRLNMFVEMETSFRARVRIRNVHKAAPATVKLEKEKAIIEFDVPQFAPAPGQIAAFYVDDYLVGAGVIEESRK